jgi:plastocyanin
MMERSVFATILRRCPVAVGLVALFLGGPACGGYGRESPTTPSETPAPPADAITINIVGVNGTQAFSPNPSTVPAGKSVVWHNLDTVSHRVVFDDGELDTGNVAPGAFSVPMGLVASASYHCSIHPSMVGRIEDGR